MRRCGEAPLKGVAYRDRPGAYGVLLLDGDVLLAAQNGALLLPGGGIDPGESPVRALHREVYEETGWHIAAPRRLGAFRRFAYMPEYDKWAEKLCHIFLATPTLRMGPPAEAGHTALWCPIGEAGDVLANEGERDFVAALRRML